MDTHLSISRSVKWLALVLLSSGGLAFAVANSNDAPDSEMEYVEPAQTNEAVLLHRLGLPAEVLCAAGVSSGEVSDLVDAVFSELASQGSTLRALDQACAGAKVSCDALRKKVRSGLGTPGDIQSLSSAKAALVSEEAARSTYVNALRDAAIDTVSVSTATNLETMLANEMWSVPTEFLLQVRSEQEWVDLRDDLATERINSKLGEAIPASVVSSLGTIRTEANVANAKTRLDTYMSSVQTAWNSAVTR